MIVLEIVRRAPVTEAMDDCSWLLAFRWWQDRRRGQPM